MDMKKLEQYRSELLTSLDKITTDIALLSEERGRLLRQLHDVNRETVEKQVEGDKILRKT